MKALQFEVSGFRISNAVVHEPAIFEAGIVQSQICNLRFSLPH